MKQQIFRNDVQLIVYCMFADEETKTTVELFYSGLWTRYSTFRLRLQLQASNFFGSSPNILRFLASAPAPEQFGLKNRKKIGLIA